MTVVKPPEILPVMVGTAGHVDHGKTSLVQLLTGCNTDALKEEKKRGLTIDLGFAPCLVSNNRMVGIVDVPGHIDFIKNMVAGAASLDILMLIVAADDSVMPQTIEHLQIVKLLRTPLLMVVLTKIDLVKPDMVELVQEDIRDFLVKAGYPEAPIIPMSNTTLDGISTVRNTLSELVTIARQRRETDPERHQAFRMNIERIFSVKGFGTVVTGIPRSGHPAIGDSVELLPAHVEGKIRSVQNYKHTAGQVLANACNAINISGIDADAVTRGMTLAAPGIYHAVTRTTVQIRNVARIPIIDGMEVRFHTGTSGVHAEVVLLSNAPIAPGTSGFIQLRLSEPVVLLAGDAFIIRRYSPSETLGGGKVISIQNAKYKRTDPDLIPRLEHAAQCVAEDKLHLAEIYAAPGALLHGLECMQLAGFSGDTAQSHLAELIASKILIPIENEYVVVRERLAETVARIERFLVRFHNEKKYTWGIEASTAAKLADLPSGCGKAWVTALAENLPEKFKLKHARLSLTPFTPQITARQMKIKEDFLKYLIERAEKIPAQGDIMADLQLSVPDYKFMVKVMLETQEIIQVGNHIFEYGFYQKVYNAALQCFKEHPEGVDITIVRDSTALSRNLCVTLLEHLDAKGLTRRNGNLRFLTGARNQ